MIAPCIEHEPIEHEVDAPLTPEQLNERGVYNTHLAHLLKQLEKMEPWPVPRTNDEYLWDCSCRWQFLAGDWQCVERCRKHKRSSLAMKGMVGI